MLSNFVLIMAKRVTNVANDVTDEIPNQMAARSQSMLLLAE